MTQHDAREEKHRNAADNACIRAKAVRGFLIIAVLMPRIDNLTVKYHEQEK